MQITADYIGILHDVIITQKLIIFWEYIIWLLFANKTDLLHSHLFWYVFLCLSFKNKWVLVFCQICYLYFWGVFFFNFKVRNNNIMRITLLERYISQHTQFTIFFVLIMWSAKYYYRLFLCHLFLLIFFWISHMLRI